MPSAAPIPGSKRRLLITAGPTHEPIDAVRYIGNRSSGRLGIALAEAAAARDWPTTLLLGPVCARPVPALALATQHFQSTTDLEALLLEHLPACDALIMAAAVADYRPRRSPEAPITDAEFAQTKLTRSAAGLTLELEPTPDLLAACSARRSPNQVLVGFALEPRARLIESARAKLKRKDVDLIVANPLETMDATSIEATLVFADTTGSGSGGAELQSRHEEPLPLLNKPDFANRLLDHVARLIDARSTTQGPSRS